MSKKEKNEILKESSIETSPAEVMIEKLLAELEKQKEENKRLKEANKKLKEEILEYQKNGVSGLRRREIFYKTLESDIEENAQEFVKDIELINDETLKEKVASWDLNEIKDCKLSILMSDLAYLSFVNREGHNAGDSLLKHIGEIAENDLGSPKIGESEKESPFIAYRHGGDEFTAIIYKPIEDAEKMAKEFNLKVEQSKIDILEKYGLKPHIDIGVAHLSEGLEAFKELIMAGVTIPAGDRLRKIENLLVGIADHRAILNKTKTRITYLMELRSKKPDVYKEVIDDLRKGALGTKDEEIDFLLKHNEVEKFIDKKIEETIKKDKENIGLEKDIIKKIARRKQ